MNKPYVRHRWELTLALTLFFVLCYAAFCSAQQETLSQDVLRLRVVANSDTQTDQAVKLRVRDQVLTVVQPMQLRIGAARGHNWWCVVYPSLCFNAAEGETTLTEDERNFIHQSGTSCEIRFRTAELLGNLRGMMS